MGVVFRASRTPDEDEVALKVLRAEFTHHELYRRRFHREARIAGELEHEHIVPVLDFGEASSRLYIAARYVRGQSLADLIRSSGGLTVAEVLRLASELAGALDSLHVRDLIHRDVKPANVMVDESGAAALTDFGLARGAADTVLTRTGAVVGTIDYLAPELILGQRADSSSDIYAFGCLVYECLGGAPPFAGLGKVETLVAHVDNEPPPLRGSRVELPDTVPWAVCKALAKDPSERPPTATAYARLLAASAEPG
jgi:serine/threonine protein kinase